ncbi:histidine phosphatase family protein [Myxococcus sp. K38C18041901]|uniref:SixA phosphatase family protein n=1 Tax=Myxococcus guangdongensis TaxID=2906760 RepID=UPI0020A7E2FA|nr:histidine phosphatase family protein [Myxococcus guangdongensis]MCP3057776.1 histidine phosphatase family protein [Myxococcus guangdongensis]
MYEPRSGCSGGGTLRIFLVRHGDADAEIPEGLGDEARWLTAKARANTAAHFASLSERMGPISLILTSPLVRTVQTAQILASALKYEGLLQVHKSLLPDMPVGTVDSLIKEHEGENLVLVGHQPSVGALATHLLGMQSSPKAVNPGTVIALERTEGESAQYKLLFYAAPGHPVLDVIQ